MPAVVTGTPQKKNEAMWDALKAHIMRERQKKKQEQEADAEVERQRKERERQQKQDVMTLGETREQIQQLETRLAQLKDEKHQLFLQLKKVLNEDDNRRRQLFKESNEMMSMHTYPAVALSQHPPLFLQQNMPLAGRAPIFKVAPTHGAQHSLLPPGALKRSRSPSPPPPNYHQGYGYKPQTIPAYSQQKVDDGRRGHEYVRAVLWNKNTQYTSSQPFYAPHGPTQVPSATTVSYTPTAAPTVYTYAAAAPQYAPPAAAVPPREEAAKPTQPHSVYMGQPRTSLATLPPHSQTYVTAIHQSMEHPVQKQSFQSPQDAAEKYYVNASRPTTHVPIHGGAIPIQQPPQGAKTGGITSGYPIRAQPVAAPPHATTGSYQPSASTPHSVYVTQAATGRLLFSQAGPPGPPGPPGHPPAHQPPPQGRYSVSGMTREV
ncbi:hypothetical protein R5R35_013966 [Gryllus longicercus]|uniref:G protein pathway suppressor 2 n=1 Tax=Gryllus longicercus TaxID=2509291 RepID=A0AAN9V458_9ORTH